MKTKRAKKTDKSVDAPTLGQWTDEARKLADEQAADNPPKAELNGKYTGDIDAPIPFAPAPTDEPIPFTPAPTQTGPALADAAIKTVLDRATDQAKEPNSTGHVNDGDWREQRKTDLRDVARRRVEMVGTMDRLKAEHAAAKKNVEALDAELLAAVRDMDKPYPPRPAKLYDDPEPEKGKSSTKRYPAPTDDQTWRSVPLASLSLSKAILQKLAKPVHKHRGKVPPIKTLGDLTEFLEPKDDWEPRLTDLKGLGKSAVDKITAATDQFWEERAKDTNAQEAKA